jgi:hypothetical protein
MPFVQVKDFDAEHAKHANAMTSRKPPVLLPVAPEAIAELDAEISFWTAQHQRGASEAHYAAFGIATGLRLAKSILLGQPFGRESAP